MSGPVHVIGQLTIHDADGYRDYVLHFSPILEAHGGEVVTYDDNVTVLEGESVSGRTVILRFESEEACLAWWNSPEYQEIAERRHAATTTTLISIVHAAPSR